MVAEHQTAGRGRLDRTWETPARSALTFSVLLRPTAPAQSWPWLPLLAGYAVDKALTAAGFDAVGEVAQRRLLALPDGQSRKVAGILVERVETTTGPAAVVGVGLNVGMTAEELPGAGGHVAGRSAGSAVPDRTDLLVDVLASLWESYAAWQEGGDLAGMRLAESYVAACVDDRPRRPGRPALRRGADRPRDRRRPERAAAGRAATGGVTAVSAGDVVHVRRCHPGDR